MSLLPEQEKELQARFSELYGPQGTTEFAIELRRFRFLPVFEDFNKHSRCLSCCPPSQLWLQADHSDHSDQPVKIQCANLVFEAKQIKYTKVETWDFSEKLMIHVVKFFIDLGLFCWSKIRFSVQKAKWRTFSKLLWNCGFLSSL